MTLRLRTVFFLLLGIIVLFLLYSEREILSPFILGGIFAYIFNPVVNFFSHKIRLPRIISVFIIYSIIVSIVVISGVVLARRVIEEWAEFKQYIDTFAETTKHEIELLPAWLKPTVLETVASLEKSRIFSPQSLFTLFPQAISRIVSFVIFLFSSYYFLKEGRSMFDKLLILVPKNYRIELDILLNKINFVLNSYLRGQVFLIFLISSILFIALSILGVRFALIVAIFSGFAEIIPIIGPVIATTTAVIVVLLTGVSHFSLTPPMAALFVTALYFVVRQIQDYFINPTIMGKITRLHPLIILFSVLAGEHIMGILGVIIAVPFAAIVRILLEYSMDKLNENETEQ